MLEGGQDAAEKFDGLCECEKFMVSMMTVKHAKRKVNALLFKLQFISCLQSIAEGRNFVEFSLNWQFYTYSLLITSLVLQIRTKSMMHAMNSSTRLVCANC